MFVFSVKTSKKQLLALVGAIAALVILIVAAVVFPGGSSEATAAPVRAKDATARLLFLRGLGYEVDPDSEEVREVLIPDRFDETFEAYNVLQRQAGMDLAPYHGKRVKRWTYTVLNYPTAVSGDSKVLAHLYIYKDKIIGGDIASTAAEGFTHGLLSPDAAWNGESGGGESLPAA